MVFAITRAYGHNQKHLWHSVSQQYITEGFEGGPQVVPNYAETQGPLVYGL